MWWDDAASTGTLYGGMTCVGRFKGGPRLGEVFEAARGLAVQPRHQQALEQRARGGGVRVVPGARRGAPACSAAN
jgi:hypothetical protein